MWRANVRALLRSSSRLSAAPAQVWATGARGMHAESTKALQECASTGNWKSALTILAELDKTGQTNSDAYELAIEALGRDKKFEAMDMLMDTMKADGVVPTTATVDMMVQVYMAQEESMKIIQLVTDRLRDNHPVSRGAFQSAIQECSTLADVLYPETILNILRKTRDCASTIGADEYASLIRCFGICKRSDLAMHALYLMKDSGIAGSVDVYTQLIRSHISVGAVNQALHVFSMSDQEGIVLGESIHAATIGKLCEKKGFWLATELFATMNAKGVQASQYCLAKMILAYIRTNNLPAARATWQRIVDHNRPASISTYLGIMSDCVVTGEMDILLEVFEELQRHYRSLPNVAYSFAIRAHGRKGDADSAVALMDKFVDMFGPPDDATPYIAVFNALARSSLGKFIYDPYSSQRVEENDPAKTKELILHYWEMMVDNVDNLQAPAYASAAGAFASNGDIGSLNRLLAHTKENLPNSEAIMYSGAISGFAKAPVDYSDYIHEFLRQMVDLNVPINDASVRAASDAFIRNEHWDYVRELLTIMHPSAFTRPEGVVGDVLSKLLDVSHWPLARATIQASLNWDVQPHIRSKPMVLQRLADNTDDSPEWKIAYSLALETVSFATINEEHVYAVCNALKVLFRAEKHNLVARLWYALKVKNQLPLPIDAYKCIVLSSLASNFEKAAVTAAEEMIYMLEKHHADIIDTTDVEDVVSVIISAFSQHNHDEMVQRLFETMEKYNLAPNGYAYLVALRSYSGTNQREEVKRLLDSFEDYMSSTHMDTEDMASTLSTLASHYAQERDDDMIIYVFELMQKFQLDPNSYAYNAAIRAYSRKEQLDKVLELQDMLATSPALVHKRVVESIFNSHMLAKDRDGLEKTITQFKCDPSKFMTSYFESNSIQSVVTLMMFQGGAYENRPCQIPQDLQMNAIKWLLSRNAVAEAAQVTLFLLQNDYRVQSHLFEQVLDRLSLEGAYELGTMLLDAYNNKRSFLNNTSGVVDSMLTMMGNARQYDAIRDTLTESSQLFDVQQYGLGMFLCMDGQAYLNVLKIFEKLRQRFIEPNGQVFCLALDSAMALKDDRVAKLILQDVMKHKFESKVNKELYSRLAFATRPDALRVDPTLVERVAQFALFLEDNGYNTPKTFLSKLLTKANSSNLQLSTKTRIHSLLRARERNQQDTRRPWWKGDKSS